MGFQEAISTCFSKYLTFEGRARRSEYWYFMLFSWIVNLVAYLCASYTGYQFIQSIVSLIMFIPGLTVSVRRLHDIGKAGTWYLVMFVPIVGFIVMLVWMTKDSEPGSNQYGSNPKEADYSM